MRKVKPCTNGISLMLMVCMVLNLRTGGLGLNMTIKGRKELEDNGAFLRHCYEVGYKRQNTILDIENFKHFDCAYKFYKEHDCDYFIEIEVWQYKGKQEIVVLDWNESKEKFELAK